MRRSILLPLLLLALAAGAGPAHAAAPITLGFTDLDTQFHSVPERPLELQHLKQARASTLRIMWFWSRIEKAKPPTDAAATDPAYAGYDFSELDALLRDTAAAGVEPLLMFYRTPTWWEGADRPSADRAPAGTWRPDAAAFGRFMTAAAKRYSGSFADPKVAGATLPRVRLWQIWNEPNLSIELTPQWVRSGGRWTASSPEMYRGLLSAGYDAVKAAHADNTVVTAGTAPYGEPTPGGPRIQPALFLRDLLCVTGRTHPKARNCRSKPAKFDVLAHHPYPIGPPEQHSLNPDDAVIPDIAKLSGPLRVALKAGNVSPRTASKPIWATEMSWDTLPDPHALTLDLQAQYAAGAIYRLWKQGVKRLYWFNLRDDDQGAGYDKTLQSGIFFRGATVAQDTAKPSLAAFRFPFVGDERPHGRATVWGIAPAGGSVTIQRKAGAKWVTITKATAGGNRVFQKSVKAGHSARLRAVQGAETSVEANVR